MSDLPTRVTILEVHERDQDRRIEKNTNGVARIYLFGASVGMAAVGIIVYWLLQTAGIPTP